MTEAQAIETICEQWAAQWASLHSDIPYELPNETFTPPPAPSTWARVSIRTTVRTQVTTGTIRQHETRGRLVVQLFGEVNVGGNQLAVLASDVRDIFEDKSLYATPGSGDFVAILSGTTTEGMTGTATGGATDGRWAMKSVSFEFWYREQRQT